MDTDGIGPEAVVAERDGQTDLVSGIRLVDVLVGNFRVGRLELDYVNLMEAVIRHNAPPEVAQTGLIVEILAPEAKGNRLCVLPATPGPADGPPRLRPSREPGRP